MMQRWLVKLTLLFRGDGEPGPMMKRIGSWMLRKVPGMLTCEAFEGFVHDYYEGRLSPPERESFDVHMQLCPMCRVHFDGYVRAIALNQRVCEDDVMPDGMPEELVGAIVLALDGSPAP